MAHPIVLTMGEPLVGYVTDAPSLRDAESFTRFAGGAELNVAVALTRWGIPAAWASVLGDDAHADYLNDLVSTLGFTPRIARATGPAALMFKATGAAGDPEVLQQRVGTAFARHTDLLESGGHLDLEGIRHVHLTGIPPGVSDVAWDVYLRLLESARAAGCTISFDPNLRPVLWPDKAVMVERLGRVASFATIVLPGESEGTTLTGQQTAEGIAEHYLGLGAQEVVIKQGASGATAWTAAGESAHAEAPPATVVDTVGAGDGFAAGYLAGMLEGRDLQGRLDLAAAFGAYVVSHRGDFEAMPDQPALAEFLSRAGQP